MRVLHVIDKLSMDGVNPSSCSVLFGEWNECLSGQDFEMEVLSLSPDQTVGQYLREREIKDLYSPFPKQSPKNVGYICEVLSDGRFDIAHLHGYGAAHFGRLASRRCGIWNVVHEHAVLKVKPQHFCIDWILRNRTDVAIAVSEAVRRFMVSGRCIPADKIHVIGNGVNLNRFREKTDELASRARHMLGLAEDNPVLGTVTRFRAEKGTADLLEAFRQIRQRIEGVRLVIVGDGELKERLHEIAQELGVDDAIIWTGFRPEVEKLMPAFDIQVIPSWTEGFPLALAEAMAIGNPIVATEVGGMIEIGRDNVNLVFVPPRTPTAIAEACINLIENTEHARKLSVNATRSAAEMGIDRSAQRLKQLYSDLLSA